MEEFEVCGFDKEKELKKLHDEEYRLEVENMYDEWLMKTENRNISYGEMAYIQNLDEKGLTELVNELQYELYEKEYDE